MQQYAAQYADTTQQADAAQYADAAQQYAAQYAAAAQQYAAQYADATQQADAAQYADADRYAAQYAAAAQQYAAQYADATQQADAAQYADADRYAAQHAALPPGHPAHHWISGFVWPHWPRYPQLQRDSQECASQECASHGHNPALSKLARHSDKSSHLLRTAPPATLYSEAHKKASQGFGTSYDPDFPPKTRSLGEDTKWEDTQHRMRWVRCCNLGLHKLWEMDSVSGHAVSPTDINQGQLGDCWLLSSIACLAEFPEAIRKLFITLEAGDHGNSYTILLFDTCLKQWVPVTVDDYLPCLEHTGASAPAFAHAGSGSTEMWVSLLEKAFAKAFGGYQNISGGWNWFAFQMLTGSDTSYYLWQQDKQAWLEDFTQYPKGSYLCSQMNCRQSGACYISQHPEDRKEPEQMWQMLKEADECNYIMAATTKGVDTMTEGKGPQASNGMVDGHAYSVLVVYEVNGHRLLCVRNPWGTFEFGGDWSDKSELWQKHPDVKRALLRAGFEQYLQFRDNDGIFWMDFKDASESFDGIIICRRGIPIEFDKRSAHADKCSHCSGDIIGKFYKRKNGTKVHTGCWEGYSQSIAPKCLQCNDPVMKIEGRFSGRFYEVDQKLNNRKGKVHTECWNGIGVWKKR